MLLPAGTLCRGAGLMAATVNASIVEHFRTLEAPRIARTKQYNLLDILVIALCTLLTGGEGFQDMELFGKRKRAWLHTFLFLCKFPKLFAFKEGMWDPQISALLSSPTVTHDPWLSTTYEIS